MILSFNASGLINNALLLLFLALLSDSFPIKNRTVMPVYKKTLLGLFSGLITIAIMLNSWNFGPGIILDTRSILLSLSGFFFGLVPTLMAISITIVYRLFLGGPGMWSGIGIILTSGGIGLAWRRLRGQRTNLPSQGELLALGIIVHLAMMLCVLILPWSLAIAVLRQIFIPIMLVYPLTTLLIGRLIVNREKRQQNELALRESADKFRRLFQEDSAIKVIIEPQSMKIVEANNAAVQFYGWPITEILQIPIYKFIDKPTSQFQKDLADVLAKKQSQFECRIRLADGSIRDITTHNSRIYIDGKVFIHSIIQDISDRKQAETEQKKLTAQLFQAQKMESVGRLAGGVAHDFNNMLSLILGYCELAIHKTDSSDPRFGELQEIKRAAEKSAEITQQLLAFARQQAISPIPLNLNHTVAGMLKMLNRLIGENIKLIWRPTSAVWTIQIDPVQVDQLLANLCVNARDAIHNTGQITIETSNVTLDSEFCSQHPGSVPGEYVLLSINDTGHGMDKETQSKIFEPFFTTKEFGKGTGLGLSTVYGIIKQNQGFIHVVSSKQTGTTFELYLPRHYGQFIQNRQTATDLAITNRGETILLVEDEDSLLSLIQELLQAMGYSVLPANNPGHAIRIAEAKNTNIHLLLTDVVMPEMNGRQLSEQILRFHPEMKVLFMSGHTTDTIVHHGMLNSGIHFIQKPFSSRDLECKLRTVLDKPQLES